MPPRNVLRMCHRGAGSSRFVFRGPGDLSPEAIQQIFVGLAHTFFFFFLQADCKLVSV